MKSRLLIATILAAGISVSCASYFPAKPTVTAPTIEVVPTLTVAPPPSSPTAPASPGCYYQWATQELPELSQRVNRMLGALDAGASGSAYAFGEDCIQPDGTRTFSAMETDFRVRIGVSTISDHETLGNKMAEVITALEGLPPADIPGPQPGRVEFEFYANEAQSLRLTVEIDKYRAEGTSLRGIQLFQLFYPPQ